MSSPPSRILASLDRRVYGDTALHFCASVTPQPYSFHGSKSIADCRCYCFARKPLTPSRVRGFFEWAFFPLAGEGGREPRGTSAFPRIGATRSIGRTHGERAQKNRGKNSRRSAPPARGEAIFGVPGESYLPLIDALYERADDAVHRLPPGGRGRDDGRGLRQAHGEPGICMVTRGPGATNASAGCTSRSRIRRPMILFIGQAKRGFLDREAFQEVDFRQMFAPLAKWAAQIDDAARIPEYVSRAFHVAVSAGRGPWSWRCPRTCSARKPRRRTQSRYTASRRILRRGYGAVQKAAGGRETAACHSWRRWMGRGSCWRGFKPLPRRAGCPSRPRSRRQDYFDNGQPCYAGDVGIGINPKLAQKVKDADLLLVLGARLSESATSGYTLVEAPRPRQKLIHVHADPGELGRNYQADLPS